MARVALLGLVLACCTPTTERDPSLWLADSPDVRARAAEGADVYAIPLLIEALEDDDARVREAAAVSLARLGRGGLAYYTRLLRTRDHVVWPYVLEELERGMARGAADNPWHLYERMRSRRSRLDRLAAAILCVWTAPAPTFVARRLDAVLLVARTDPNESVREAAAAASALHGWARAVPAHPPAPGELRIALAARESTRFEQKSVAVAVVWALRPPATAHDPTYDVPLADLRKALARDESWLSWHEVVALGKLAPAELSEFVPAIRRRVTNGETTWLLASLARTLVAASPQDLPAVERALTRAVLEEHDKESLVALDEIAPDHVDVFLRVLALPDLDPIADERGIAGFIDEPDEHEWVRVEKRIAVNALSRRRGEAGVAALRRQLTSHDARLRYRAAKALRLLRTN